MKPRAFNRGVLCMVVLLGLTGTAPAQEPAPVSSHEKAARDLYQLLGGAKLAETGAEAMMGTIRQNPELAPYEDVFRAWFRKVFADGDLESEMVSLYVEAFTESELRELEAFYRTPIGQKSLAALPALTQKGAEIGMRRGQEHSAELEEMLAKAKQERGQQTGSLTGGEAQRKTIADMRNIGTAMFSWLTDQVSASAAGQSQKEETKGMDLERYPLIPHAELEKILVPDYLQKVPEVDGWGHPYEFRLNVENPLAEQVMSIRSAGQDGKFSATDYSVSAFTPEDFDQDIVWADGFFVRWPQRAEQ